MQCMFFHEHVITFCFGTCGNHSAYIVHFVCTTNFEVWFFISEQCTRKCQQQLTLILPQRYLHQETSIISIFACRQRYRLNNGYLISRRFQLYFNTSFYGHFITFTFGCCGNPVELKQHVVLTTKMKWKCWPLGHSREI